MSHQGWTNYETWAVALWIDNEEGSQSHWAERAGECWAEAEYPEEIHTRSEAARYALADELKETITDGNPLLDTNSLYSDLLTAAIGEANWGEIANSLLDDLDGYESFDYRTGGQD